jgi:hypothetical protein
LNRTRQHNALGTCTLRDRQLAVLSTCNWTGQHACMRGTLRNRRTSMVPVRRKTACCRDWCPASMAAHCELFPCKAVQLRASQGRHSCLCRLPRLVHNEAIPVVKTASRGSSTRRQQSWTRVQHSMHLHGCCWPHSVSTACLDLCMPLTPCCGHLAASASAAGRPAGIMRPHRVVRTRQSDGSQHHA